MKHIGILGTGAYVPEQILPNCVLEASLSLKKGWISTKTGIHERHVASAHEATSDLATRAAQQALTQAGIAADELDLIVVATSTPDFLMPATACIVQNNLRAKQAAAFDISAVCTGFIYALTMVQAAMCGCAYFRKALVIGAEVYSRILDYGDPKTCVLFGDGAGAVVLGEVPEGYGILSTYLRADGSKAPLVHIPAGGSRKPINAQALAEREHLFHMDGRGVRAFLANTFSDVLLSVLSPLHIPLDTVDLFIPHQANGVILHEALENLGVPEEKVSSTIKHYGNTAAASVPLTLHHAFCSGKIMAEQYILLFSFGGGMTWGSCLLRWQPIPSFIPSN